ncbi:MAG: dihydroneopterin aldolase [Negativicutes bacterium]|nr:dihydroneopterin aldolase [Negativicutes bacterium]
MNDKILLQNMMFYGYHGVYEYEREQGQRFYVDVELELNFGKAAISDDWRDTIDYVGVYNQIKSIFETQRFKLMEALAGHIAATLLKEPVLRVTVSVRKPGVPLPGQVDFVQIETTRSLQG